MVEIRTATTQDKDAVQFIYESLLGPDAMHNERIWDRLIQAQCLLVAQVDGQIIGFGGIDLNSQEQVKWLYLLPQGQGNGIGSMILRRLENIGWSAGCERIRLHSAPQAVEFYRKQGYRELEASQHLEHSHEGVEMVKERRTALV